MAGVAYRKAVILTCLREKIADFVFILSSPLGGIHQLCTVSCDAFSRIVILGLGK